MAEEKHVKNKKRLQGAVVSDKMAKTIVAKVTIMKMHPKYRKRYKVSKNFKIHDEKKIAKVGDIIIFEACRPFSKDKKWRLISIIKK